MSDERPIDLASLGADEPEIVRASIRRFRRRILVLGAWGLLFVLSGAAIATDAVHDRNLNPIAMIASGSSLNDRTANYQVGPIDVGLLKVVALPNDQVGMQFVLHSTSALGTCCTIYPHEATSSNDVVAGDSRFGQVLVVIPRSLVSPAGTVDMLLTNRNPAAPTRLGRFTVDLAALHVHGIGG